MPLGSKPTRNGSSRTRIVPEYKAPLSQTHAYLFQSPLINGYIDALMGAKATKKAHRHDLREFEAWNASLENKKGKKFVEEIDKAHMRRFFEYLVDDEPENYINGNTA